VQAEALGGFLGENDALVKRRRLVHDLAVEVQVHAEINHHFVRRLRDAADVRVGGFQFLLINDRHDRGGRIGFVHKVRADKTEPSSRPREKSAFTMFSPVVARQTGKCYAFVAKSAAPVSISHFLMETTDAILLRRTRFGDTSFMITWLTRDQGRITTAAKGAQRPKSVFSGKLDLFFECEIQFVRSKKSTAHTLREVALIAPRESLRRDYTIVQLCGYFCELLEHVTEPEHPAPELFDLLQRALNHLQEKPASLRALLHFETETARLLGVHGQAGVTPAVALGRAYHRLPSSRPALMKMLSAAEKAAES